MTEDTHPHNCLIIGASGGIGRRISESLAKLGYNLFIHGRSAEKLNQQAQQLKESGSCHVRTIVQDIQNREDVFSLLHTLQPHIGQIDVLIVAFGPMIRGSIAETDAEQTAYLFDTNLLLPALLIEKLAPAMAENNWGRIILFGGTATDSLKPYRTIALYSSAKYALNSLARSAAVEFGHFNVTTNVICPGYVETEYYDKKELLNLKKAGKLLEPDKISDIIKFLIQGFASGVNGSIINAGAAREW